MTRLGYRVAAHLRCADAAPVSSTDAELLALFANTHDEAAFTELVNRHRRLVHATARRYLGDPHAADDVTQATFLVLAGKAGSVQWGATVGPWLHATAVRLSRKASSRIIPVLDPHDIPAPQTDAAATMEWTEFTRLLDRELSDLPELVRDPLILCYLQGRTRDEAAKALGCSLAMLKRRLDRGRRLLRDRLTRHGVTLPMVGLALLITDLPATASTSAAIAHAAVEYATLRKAPTGVAALLGATSSTLKLKVATLAILVASLVACGVALAAFRGGDEQKPAGKSEGPQAPTPARADTQGDQLPARAVARLGTLRLRPGANVERLAFSPDGTKIASWSSDSHVTDSLIIWDTKTGAALRRVDLPGARVDCLVWLADGRGIALVRSSFDESVPLVWEFTDEKAEKPPVKPRERIGKSVAVPEKVEDNEYDSCYAICPDGKTLAVGKAGQLKRDREVWVWRLKTGVKADMLAPIKKLATHPDNCGELYFTPDAKTLVVFTSPKHLGNNKFEDQQLVTVWDVATGKETRRFVAPCPAGNGDRRSIALSNQLLAIGLETGSTSVWDLTTGKDRTLATGIANKKGGAGIFAIAITPDGKSLATAGRDGVTRLWDLASDKLLNSLSRHYSWVEVLTISPTGNLIASAGQDGLIRLWDAKTGADACPQPGHTYAVGHVAFSADGKTAITGGWDNSLRWWDSATGAQQRVVAVPDGIMGLVLSPDGKTVLVAADEGKLLMWDLASGREAKPANLPQDLKFQSLTFTPDGRHLLASSGSKVSILEWPTLKLARAIDLPKPGNTILANPPAESENACQVAAVSPDGKWLVTVAHRSWYVERDGLRFGYASDGVVDLWDFATGKRIRRLVESGGTFRTGAFTADGLFVLIGAGGKIPAHEGRDADEFQGEMNLLDPVAGRRVHGGFEVPPVSANVALRYSGASALSPDGRTLYVSYNTGEIIGYEVATGRPQRTIAGHSGYVASSAFSPDGRRLISGSRDGTALMWDVTLAGSAQRRAPLTETEAEKLWVKVAEGEPQAAYTALAELAASPDIAVGIVRRHVRPAPPAPTDQELDRLFTDLDSPEFGIREKASKLLAEYGEVAVPGVRKKLEGDVGQEARQRAIVFLKEFQPQIPRPLRVRQGRAIELLEGLRTPEARKLLTELSKGAATAPLTLDAAAALKRLGHPE